MNTKIYCGSPELFYFHADAPTKLQTNALCFLIFSQCWRANVLTCADVKFSLLWHYANWLSPAPHPLLGHGYRCFPGPFSLKSTWVESLSAPVWIKQYSDISWHPPLQQEELWLATLPSITVASRPGSYYPKPSCLLLIKEKDNCVTTAQILSLANKSRFIRRYSPCWWSQTLVVRESRSTKTSLLADSFGIILSFGLVCGTAGWRGGARQQYLHSGEATDNSLLISGRQWRRHADRLASFFILHQSRREQAALLNRVRLRHMVPTQTMMCQHVTLGRVILR